MEDDVFYTIDDKVSEAIYTEKRSKFLAFAHHIHSADEATTIVKEYHKKYYDARHVCYAYMIGPDRKEFRANDNGEPSGTAGKPILGQINSHELTDILIVVIRYFGGIKLGTSGLIVAYKAAAASAIENANILKKTVDKQIIISFEYPHMNDVMRVVKEEEPKIISQNFEMDCLMTLSTRESKLNRLCERFEKLRCVKIDKD